MCPYFSEGVSPRDLGVRDGNSSWERRMCRERGQEMMTRRPAQTQPGSARLDWIKIITWFEGFAFCWRETVDSDEGRSCVSMWALNGSVQALRLGRRMLCCAGRSIKFPSRNGHSKDGRSQRRRGRELCPCPRASPPQAGSHRLGWGPRQPRGQTEVPSAGLVLWFPHPRSGCGWPRGARGWLRA